MSLIISVVTDESKKAENEDNSADKCVSQPSADEYTSTSIIGQSFEYQYSKICAAITKTYSTSVYFYGPKIQEKDIVYEETAKLHYS